jgi:hypothetical protein
VASPFSGRAGRLAGMWAANQATQGLGQIMGTLSDAENRAGNFLTEGYETGQDVLGGGYADSMEALRAGYGTAREDLQAAHRTGNDNLAQGIDYTLGLMREGRDRGTQQLVEGRDQALGYLNQGNATLQGAAGAYDPLIQRGLAGYDMYSNSLGLNGAAGNAAARGAFQAGPGYQWQVEQATDAAQRAANKTGSLYGGNVIDATTRLGSNLANQEYGNWQTKLQPYMGASQAAVTGKAGQLDLLAQNYGKMGDVSSTTGNQLANLSSSTGQAMGGAARATALDISNLNARMGAAQAGMKVDEGQQYANADTSYGNALASLAGGYGGSMASLITGTAGNIAQAEQAANNSITQSGTQGLLAGQQAATNSWGAILGGLGLGTKLLGTSLGSSSSPTLLGSLFK